MIVEDLLKAKGLDYTSRGRDFVIRCLNPEHEDKNPSLRIDKILGVFNCLSCGYKGNLFTYYGEKPNGLQIRRERLKSIIQDKIQTSVGFDIPKNAVVFNRDWRGISGITFSSFKAFQHNDPEFIGRVVFPIYSTSDKLVGFVGRHTADGTPRYLNHPPNCKLPLYPANAVPIKGSVLLVEGLLDMVNLHDKGLTNAICCFGVNKVTAEKLNLLKIRGVTNLDIFFDADTAGEEGAKKLKELAERSEFSTRIVTYKNCKDPGELTAPQVIKLKEFLYGK